MCQKVHLRHSFIKFENSTEGPWLHIVTKSLNLVNPFPPFTKKCRLSFVGALGKPR